MATAKGVERLTEYTKAAQALLSKSEGRDKFLATLQYAAMIAAAGQAGRALSIQKNLSASRKPFRFMKPVESLLPLLTSPPGPMTPLAATAKLKSVAMALFFGMDHLVWAGSAGLVGDKKLLERAQEVSFYGWLLGSLCQLVQEVVELAKLKKARDALAAPDAPPATSADGKAPPPVCPDPAVLAKAKADADAALTARALSAATVATQAALAAALLKLLPLSPRATGALGVATSALSLYQLFPPLPPAKKKAE